MGLTWLSLGEHVTVSTISVPFIPTKEILQINFPTKLPNHPLTVPRNSKNLTPFPDIFQHHQSVTSRLLMIGWVHRTPVLPKARTRQSFIPSLAEPGQKRKQNITAAASVDTWCTCTMCCYRYVWVPPPGGWGLASVLCYVSVLKKIKDGPHLESSYTLQMHYYYCIINY